MNNVLDQPCGGLDPIVKIIKKGVFPIVQIGIPILLIVFGTIDLGKAVISSDEKEVKQVPNPSTRDPFLGKGKIEVDLGFVRRPTKTHHFR